MCLGIPGEVVSIDADPLGLDMGRVRFGGVTKEVCLAYVPEVEVGDYVLVHVGFALAKIDEAEARRTHDLLAAGGGLDLAGRAPPGSALPGRALPGSALRRIGGTDDEV